MILIFKLIFFKKINFSTENKKVSFKIGGNHLGRKILIADDSGKLEKKQCFNNKIQEVNNVERKSIANNLVQFLKVLL